MEGISRNFWSKPHLEPGPFKFEYSQRGRTRIFSRQPFLIFDNPIVKTFLLISSWNFSCSNMCLLPPVLSHLAELTPESRCLSCTGELKPICHIWSQKYCRGKGWLPSLPAEYSLANCCPFRRDTLLTLVRLVYQDPQVLAAFSASALDCTGPWHLQAHTGFLLSSIELHKVPVSPGLCMDHSPQLGIIHKIAECSLLLIFHKDIECSSDMNEP